MLRGISQHPDNVAKSVAYVRPILQFKLRSFRQLGAIPEYLPRQFDKSLSQRSVMSGMLLFAPGKMRNVAHGETGGLFDPDLIGLLQVTR
jgi:hypothetical protein